MGYQNNAARQGNNRQGNGEQRQYKKESDFDKRIVVAALAQIRDQYARTLVRHGLNVEEEVAFIWTIFTSNLSLLEKACAEPEQFKRALLTQASVGLSLDPSRQLSYLVVRKYKLIWDIGYRGLLKIAVDEGVIGSAKPELVYAKDRFEFRGQSEPPIHSNADFFGDRGQIVGAYVVATLPGGGVMVETMREQEFIEISALNPDSDAWKKEFSKGEMRKKTLIKRASKWWYNAAATGKTDRLQAAITYLNEEVGEGIPKDEQPPETPPTPPQVPADDQVPEGVKKRVAMIIGRASAQGAWEPCKDYLREKFSGAELAWALTKLQEAEEAASAPPSPDTGADIPPGD